MHMHNRLVVGLASLVIFLCFHQVLPIPVDCQQNLWNVSNPQPSWTTECPFTFKGVTVGNMTVVFNATCTLNGTISDNPLPCRPNFIDISGTRIALYCYAVKEHEGGSNRTLG